MVTLKQPSQKTLENAREEFHSLVLSNALENKFQKLFFRCPFILSRAIPLRIEAHELHALAHPGKSEPDFIFFPQQSSPLNVYGVIELKRPTTKLITTPRKDMVILSRDAQTAITQGQKYAEKLERELMFSTSKTVFLGSRGFVFVIAGLSTDILRQCSVTDHGKILDGLIPSGCQIIPYDTLFDLFAKSIPPRVILLNPIFNEVVIDIHDLLREVRLQPLLRYQINDDNVNFWAQIEEKWYNGKFLGSRWVGAVRTGWDALPA